jgi:serine protease Do
MKLVRCAVICHVYICLAIFIVPIASASSTAEKVYENAKDSIFPIFSVDEENKEKTAFGTGVAVTKELIATNCHVALSGRFLLIEVNYKNHLGRLFYYNQKHDLCLIEIVGSPLNPVNIRPSKSVRIGEEVFAIGNPEMHEKTISRGIISNKLINDGIEILQTDASISQGSSGGGLFDMDGNLIGLTFATHKTAENMTYALPTELIIDVLGKEKKGEKNENVGKLNAGDSSGPQFVEKNNNNANDNRLIRIGYYGEDEVSLMKWNGRCFIGIVGRYRDEPKSLAIWFPNKPEGLFIFSRIVSADDAIKYFKIMNENESIKYVESKSYLYFDGKLYPLPIMTIGDAKQPVYVFAMSGAITEELIELDYFVSQFYRYTQVDGMTTIKFGLSGFTEAYGEYTKQCK